MTITIIKSINLVLILTTFLTGLVAFDSVTTTAYNNTNYYIACPSDFPYCDYKPTSNSNKYCHLPTDIFATDCITNNSKSYYPPVEQNKTTLNNYSTQYYGNFNCYYYTNKCNSTSYQTPTTYSDIYYTPATTNNSYNSNYCSYLNPQYNEHCTNIAVNPPKTYDIPNEQYYPTNTDPIRNCYLNTSKCIGSTMNDNTTSYSFDGNYYIANDQNSNVTGSNQTTYQDYYTSSYYPIQTYQGAYNTSNENYYYDYIG